jgi:hypothetical protein
LIRRHKFAWGIHPFNPNIITAQQVKPSEPKSTHTAFVQPQSSPVRAVLAGELRIDRHPNPLYRFGE